MLDQMKWVSCLSDNDKPRQSRKIHKIHTPSIQLQFKVNYSDLLFEAEFDEVGPVVWKCFGRFLTILERLTQTNRKQILDLLTETITWMYISFLSGPWRDNPNSNFMGCLLRTGVFYIGVNMFGSVSWTHQYKNHPTQTLLWGDSFLLPGFQCALRVIDSMTLGQIGDPGEEMSYDGQSRHPRIRLWELYISESRSDVASSLTYNAK
jgi:hypothetical protein